ncbi:MAG: 2-oxoacid:acceptor oxidoreductase family protein [Oscillospiraceae bacterium]
MQDKIIIAGQGGQGALRIGQMIAYAAMSEGKETTWLPSYGAEMRGGTANCSVIVAGGLIASPIISAPNYCIVMNRPSLLKFESWVQPGGALIVDSSMASDPVTRTDISVYEVPADTIAEEEGNSRGTNMVLLGVYLALSGNVELSSVFEVIDNSFTGRKAKYADSNKRLVQRGYDFVKA